MITHFSIKECISMLQIRQERIKNNFPYHVKVTFSKIFFLISTTKIAHEKKVKELWTLLDGFSSEMYRSTRIPD